MKTLEDVLEEITPKPDADFIADMERRMEQGFPREPSRLPRLALPQFRPRSIAGVAASAVLALVVAASLVGGDHTSPAPRPQPLPETQAASGGAGEAQPGPRPHRFREAQRRTLSSGKAVPYTAQSDNTAAPHARTRRVEQSAQLTLAADRDDFDSVADSIFRIADRHRGFVLRSSFTEGEGSTGSFELRVPARDLESALNELSQVASVRSRSESSNDVTAPFVSVRDRLRTARALRTNLLRRLEIAPTDTAVEALRARLAIVGRRIASLRGELRGLRERTQFATVLVELVDKSQGAVTGKTDEAVDDAVGSLEDVLNFSIRALGVLVPAAVVALLAWLGAAYARRRARERALA